MEPRGSDGKPEVGRVPASGLLATWSPSLRIVAGYVAFALLWFPLSDLAARSLADHDLHASIQVFKGWAFIAITALALYIVLKRTIDSMQGVLEEESRKATLLRALFESPALGIAVVDNDGKYLEVNQGFADMLGRRPEELVGMNFRDVTVPEDIFITEAMHDELRVGVNSGIGVEKRYLKPDGTVTWGLMSAAPIRGDRKELAVAVIKDVTQRIRREDDLREALEQLRQIDDQRRSLLIDLVRAEEVEQQRIANNIHDDSMPTLASAAMGLDLLAEKLKDKEHVALAERSAEDIRNSISRLRSLVFELETPGIETEDLPGALELLLKTHCAEIECELVSEPGLEMPSEMKLVLYKVAREAVLNVHKHSKARTLSVSLDEHDSGMRLRIKDDGAGFEFTEGAALQHHFGLKQMSDRAQAAGGRLSVRTSPGRGVEVQCWLPHEHSRGSRSNVGP